FKAENTRKVCLDISLVWWPLMDPSLTDQYSARPVQPARSWPLKSVMKPSASGFARGTMAASGAFCANCTMRLAPAAPADTAHSEIAIAAEPARQTLPCIASLFILVSAPSGATVHGRL